jgi:hypothetical protein
MHGDILFKDLPDSYTHIPEEHSRVPFDLITAEIDA